MITPGSGKWIGILGGGQLGRMIALEGRRMGFHVLNWTGGDVSGAAETADRVIEDPFDSPRALEDFISSVDVATVEFENIPAALMEAVEKRIPLMPGSHAVATCQHRVREKRFLDDNGFPCAKFKIVAAAAELVDGMQALDCDTILKTAEFGYDGKGQLAIDQGTSPDNLQELWTNFGATRAVLEEKVSLAAELSVIVARSTSGEMVAFDPAENVHRNHILDLSIVPARLPEGTLRDAAAIASKVTEKLNYIGILAVELFLTTDGRLLINELAPRPHNSGHHTLEACHTSQFEQLLRVITRLPLGSPKLIKPTVMMNLLGDLWPGPNTPPDWTQLLSTPGAQLHLYGKSEARPGRKMGHVTVLADDIDTALQQVATCRQHLGLPPV